MRDLLTEKFSFQIEKYQKKDGTEGKKAVLLGDATDDPYNVKDILKKYGWNWDKISKKWFIWLSNEDSKNQWIIDNKVNPVLDELAKVEDNGANNRTSDQIRQEFLAALKDIDQILATPTTPDTRSIKEKLEGFREELINCVNSEEFKKKFEPIIKFRQAQGHRYSLTNIILIYCQDPEATLVKSKGKWFKIYNRTVKPNSPAIALWVPNTTSSYTKTEKDEITKDFLKQQGKTSVDELTPGEKDVLDTMLKGDTKSSTTFSLQPFFYDVRYTEQIKDKPDVVGNMSNAADVEWFSEGEYNENTENLFAALMETIKECGIKVDYRDNLGGARGVSRSGSISILSGVKHSTGTICDLTHEFAHELLHQKYLSSRDKEWAQYFVGKGSGQKIVEEQAEITAWIVLRAFGYDMPTSINYAGMWGINADNAKFVFDTVAKTATFIIDKLYSKLGIGMNEARTVKDPRSITGLDVAKMVGMGDLYVQSARRNGMVQTEGKRAVRINENILHLVITEAVKRVLSGRRNR